MDAEAFFGSWGSSPRVRGKRASPNRRSQLLGLIPACAGKTPAGGATSPWNRAHPRVCGENSPGWARLSMPFGSSPRVRGKRGRRLWSCCCGGLIPACAGKTSSRCSRGRRQPAHPRVCGENRVRVLAADKVRGSSPRVRGKPTRWRGVARWQRLIPACAGKTWTHVLRPPRRHGSSPRVRGKHGPAGESHLGGGLIPACAGKTGGGRARCTASRAHPRVCGENTIPRPASFAYVGSSPRVRGKQPQPRPPSSSDRLIPACAGKTHGGGPMRVLSTAHPRVCGENMPTDAPSLWATGSSPRVRGKRLHRIAPAPGVRLIPARAGKTGARPRAPANSWAHPRACGENCRRTTRRPTRWGSSPRVRGKRREHRRRRRLPGLIPARAGKTPVRGSGRPSREAHPRACGENPLPRVGYPVLSGSSPRVRGKRQQDRHRQAAPRLIPARAGKTRPRPGRSAAAAAHPRACGENSRKSVR